MEGRTGRRTEGTAGLGPDQFRFGRLLALWQAGKGRKGGQEATAVCHSRCHWVKLEGKRRLRALWLPCGAIAGAAASELCSGSTVHSTEGKPVNLLCISSHFWPGVLLCTVPQPPKSRVLLQNIAHLYPVSPANEVHGPNGQSWLTGITTGGVRN